MRRVWLLAITLVVALAAVSVAPAAGVAIAAGGADSKFGPASVGPVAFPCGTDITFTGTTADSYFSERSGTRHFYALTSQFKGSHPTEDGPPGVHVLKIQGSGVFSHPTGHDATGDYFDFRFDGSVTGPQHNYKLTGTWRVWVKNDHIVTDGLLTLSLNGSNGPAGVPGILC